MKRYVFLGIVLTLFFAPCIRAQHISNNADIPIMETGGKTMPNQWIDKDTGHRVVKLSNRSGSNRCFYFHNNPFVGNEMLFHGTIPAPLGATISPGMGNALTQIFAVNLKTLNIRQVTQELYDVDTEVLCKKTKELFYQHNDTVFCFNIKSMSKRIITVIPRDLKGTIYAVNCNGSILAGVLDCPEMDSLLAQYPKQGEHFRVRGLSEIERSIFTIDIHSGKVRKLFSDGAWLSHLQFSPTNPSLLMFCHEGPWDEVDRIWIMDVVKQTPPRLMHKRRIKKEIAGHEWWGKDGKYIYFDLQMPVGKKFFIGKVDVRTGKECEYELQRDEWSVHFNSSPNDKLLAGDGGTKNSVAASLNGQWIYKYDYENERLKTTRLVNMRNSNYRIEPNVHFSPNRKWVIFQSNFEGKGNIYAVGL